MSGVEVTQDGTAESAVWIGRRWSAWRMERRSKAQERRRWRLLDCLGCLAAV